MSVPLPDSQDGQGSQQPRQSRSLSTEDYSCLMRIVRAVCLKHQIFQEADISGIWCKTLEVVLRTKPNGITNLNRFTAQVARNKAIDHLRRQNNHHVQFAHLDEYLAVEDHHQNQDAGHEEMLTILMEEFENLPELQKCIIKMTYYDGLSTRKIEKNTGLPKSTVANWLKTIHRDLRQKLQSRGLSGEDLDTRRRS